MSHKEVDSYEIIKAFLDGILTRQQAAGRLKLSERAVTNRANKIRKHGVKGACHGNQGKVPESKKSHNILYLKQIYANIGYLP